MIVSSHSPPTQAAEPALFDVAAVAGLLGCSQRHVWRLADSGRMPAALKLGALRRWRAGEIRSWIDAGCPAVRTLGKGGAR